jgi:L-histidine N-alpha-methyltransferase
MAIHRHPAGPLVREGGTDCQSVPRPDDTFLADVLRGLSRPQKLLPCKYFYDERGSQLFEAICRTPEYYPTRTELAIMRRHAAEMAGLLGARRVVVELGSGSGWKTRLLLRHLPRPAAYVPVDVSSECLMRFAAELRGEFPDVEVAPVAADFTRHFEVPDAPFPDDRRAVYFPGSTIGNFETDEARRLLARMAELCGPDGALLIGIDLVKALDVLEAAYNDRQGVTAAFNLNLLQRINRELGADFDLSSFRHRAFYDEALGRIEMHLVSTRPQTVRVGGRAFRFEAGETIHTENSHKYAVAGFASLAGAAGWRLGRTWTDADALFAVQLYQT